MKGFVARRLAGTPLERPARKLYQRLSGGGSMTPVRRRNLAYDAMTAEIIKRTLSRSSNAVDAGAHEGAFLRQILHAAPDGRHFAFEPIPLLADRLRAEFPTATVHQIALSDDDGEATFRYMPDHPAESSLFRRPDREEGHAVRTLTVPTRRLDSVVPDDLRIDFLKIDVENAEAALLRGAAGLLARSQPVVVLECHVDALPEVAGLLGDAGLHVALVDDFLAGRRRSRDEVLDLARARGEWYFAAAAS